MEVHVFMYVCNLCNYLFNKSVLKFIGYDAEKNGTAKQKNLGLCKF